ncbi:MAG TPA: SMP-30/gluconolactonase/LRE family protein [Acidimicrobiia bacterium]|nr:SMP-30/gluconolactonase/LRE family protein [Acidimicrobiia bacterium]
MTLALTASPYLDVGAHHGEGVVWDAARRRLLFVDITTNRIFDHDPATGTTHSVDIGRHVGAVAPRARGGFVVAVREGFGVVQDGRIEVVAAPYARDPSIRMNDGACDPAGRFLAGSMAYDIRSGAGTLFRLDADLSLHVMLRDVSISNGIDWSSDGTRCFYVDTPTGRIDVFDYDVGDGTMTNRQPFVTVDPAAGGPDGLTIDREGGVWVALYGGSAVHRYAPDGELSCRVAVAGARLVTSCCFGGADHGDLYISTSTEHLSADERAAQPNAGRLFVVRPGWHGRPAPAFAG